MEDTVMEDMTMDTPPAGIYMPPSIHVKTILSGASYTHFSPVPPRLLPPPGAPADAVGEPCILGIDEAGRGPVLGPMVYAAFYLPATLSDPLLRERHHFDDSKVLTPAVRSALMEKICTATIRPPSSTAAAAEAKKGKKVETDDDDDDDGDDDANDDDLHGTCGWATSALSARDISSNMLQPCNAAAYNLNQQAHDATIDLLRGVLARGVNVTEVYVDTVGPPASHQARLQRFFPNLRITVAKKADSLYPCVSAASVCAKVTRDAALEVLFFYHQQHHGTAAAAGGGDGTTTTTATTNNNSNNNTMAWGSGYPSDARCVTWLRQNMHPVFGWGPECRFSWGTAKDMMEGKAGVRVDWPVDDDDGENSRVTDFFVAGPSGDKSSSELGTWYGTPAGLEAF